MNEPHLHARILSRPELMAPIRAMLCELASRAGLDETECGHIALSIDEALTNIIRHGYKNDPDSHIWISVWELENPKGLRIQMDDLAPHVELEQLKSRDLDDIRPGGLGVHLIHSLMDTVHFSKRPEGGMRLVVEKFHALVPANADVNVNNNLYVKTRYLEATAGAISIQIGVPSDLSILSYKKRKLIG